MDLAKPIDKKLVRETIGEKKLDLLVNNAGMVNMQLTTEWNQKDYEEMFSVHYAQPIELLNLFHERLDGGMVISTLSDSTHVGWPRFGLYGASKVALWLHMKTYATEYPGITVYNLHPSGIDTPIIDHVDPETMAERAEFMSVKDITTVFVQLVTGALVVNSGSSIVLHNDWQEEEMHEIGKDMYIYNVDTESLNKL